ncbi:MAG TPA: adenylate/guanylate cyclase domain-containing protein [Burkholderiales bacterium]|nr:adenylate/guanylate cyclase domain-containing protein [Burkholderiales bacterium]HYA47191.1 adenylate/guanylate cyclase domain-containing protein [Burkholderiales bacterium]
MPEHTNRTFICSVLFLDIVEYSQEKVAEQIALKERFNEVLTEAIAGVPTDDRIILDTGDGAAVSFLGDPEDTLFASMSLRDAVADQQAAITGPRLRIRVGINLGPVRLVKDINGNPNIIGDGINVAQRVMSFAQPGQILVSRSYYDVMARLSEDYAKLFHYEGPQTDKHVREHELYSVGSGLGSLRRTAPTPTARPSMHLPSLRLPRFLKLSPRRWPQALAVNSKLLVAAPLAFTLIVGTGVIARSHRNDDETKPAPAVLPPRVAPAPKAEVASPKPAPVEEAPAPQPKAEEPRHPAKEAKPVHRPKDAATKPLPQSTKASGTEAHASAPAIVPETVATIAPAAPAPRDATVNIIALPWAEVFIDGARQGVSPPLKAIPLKPGKHKVELRNGSFPPYVQTVELRSGAEISITHRFRR